MNKDISLLIQSLSAHSERQLEAETASRQSIEKFLTLRGVEFKSQEYPTYIPHFIDWGLEADGEMIPSLPCGLVSGEINSKSAILSSLISSQHNLYDANINFNPECETISRSNFYFAPALAIQRSVVQKIINADNIKGRLVVEKILHRSANILVGNQSDPKVIVFSHYDSVSTGTIDNASGTALTLDLIVGNQELLNEVLFVICGNEEISYDEPVYWGHGYREFESAYEKQLVAADSILVLDSLGHSEPHIITDSSLMKLGFPISSIEEMAGKTRILAGSFDMLMSFYHAENDSLDKINEVHYQETYITALKLIKEKLN